MKRRAFTLVELLVVLAVIAIISALTFGVIGNTIEANKKASCVSNLSQVYGALRLYAQDYDGEMPYYNPDTKAGQPEGGIGLWALTTYPQVTAGVARYPNASVGAPRTGYLRSREKLHCPSDRFNIDPSLESYASYQVLDDVPTTASVAYRRSYQTFRESESRRQLRYYKDLTIPIRRISDTTVITWCRYHRGLKNDAAGNTRDVNNANNRDNVLFFDGRVQSLPIVQPFVDGASATDGCTLWQRVPLQFANEIKKADKCEPAN